jgi:hypothetical protein
MKPADPADFLVGDRAGRVVLQPHLVFARWVSVPTAPGMAFLTAPGAMAL